MTPLAPLGSLPAMHIHCIGVVLAFALLGGRTATAQSARPLVLVVGTGGTIGSAGDYWTGNSTRVAIADLVKIPGIDSIATVETDQFLNVPSSAMRSIDRNWLISTRLRNMARSR